MAMSLCADPNSFFTRTRVVYSNFNEEILVCNVRLSIGLLVRSLMTTSPAYIF